ncbi:hypothetical protein BDF21DRAFT_491922 [Thamnidium elegans]|nr:hypothetical protein BDF21DRAFT_491922 [Thamnidium elegans]
MVFPKKIIHFFVKINANHLRMKELELKLSNRAKQLRYYVNECEKLKNAFVKIKEKENAVEGELNLAKCRLKNSDDTVEVLLKAIDDLNVKKNSLYQEMASLTAGMLAIPANHDKDMAKMLQTHFVTITELKRKNSALKDKVSDDFVFV